MNTVDVLRERGLDFGKLPTLFGPFAAKREVAALSMSLVGCESARRIGQVLVLALLPAFVTVDDVLEARSRPERRHRDR